MGRRRRAGAARTTLRAVVRARGSAEEQLAAIEILRGSDRAVFEPCAQLIRAGNAERALRLLDEVAGPEAPDPELVGAGAGGAAAALSWAAWLAWAAVAAVLWLFFPGLGGAGALLVVGWGVTLTALVTAGGPARAAYEHYSALAYLGALVFLALPPMTPIGLVWTLACAAKVRAGRVDGPGQDPQPGGGYLRFEQGNIGAAGRPIARTLFAVALGHGASVAAIVLRSGILEHVSIVQTS